MSASKRDEERGRDEVSPGPHDHRLAPFAAHLALRAGSFGAVQVTRVKIGTLDLPSGRIVSADPAVQPERRPFKRRVPVGRYPAHLSIARCADPEDQRVAYASVQFARTRPVRWELAVTPGERVATLDAPDALFGCCVDAGLACFMDAATAKLLVRRGREGLEQDPYFSYFDCVLDEELYRDGASHDWTDHRPDPDERGNCLVFSSGLGDGVYASYFGLDAVDVPVCLVTDFRVVQVLDIWAKKAQEKQAQEEARASRRPARRRRAR